MLQLSSKTVCIARLTVGSRADLHAGRVVVVGVVGVCMVGMVVGVFVVVVVELGVYIVGVEDVVGEVVVVVVIGVVVGSLLGACLRHRPYLCHMGSGLVVVLVFLGVGSSGGGVVGLGGVFGGLVVVDVVAVVVVEVVVVSFFWVRLRQRPYRCHMGRGLVLLDAALFFMGVDNKGGGGV